MRFKPFVVFLILLFTSQFLHSQNMTESPTLPNHFLLNSHTSTQGDINLAELTLNFTETDLTIPGKNGLDVVIQREYNTKHWLNTPNTNPIQNHRWGSWAGQGWHFNLAPRAFIAHSDTQVKIAIDMNGVIDLYHLDLTAGGTAFIPHRPGNFNQVFWDKANQCIQMQTTSGILYSFKTGFYDEGYVSASHYLKGFFLTEIKDPFNNKITFSYTQYRNDYSPHLGFAEMNHILGNIWPWYEKIKRSGAKKHYYYRPHKITDSYGREITISYRGNAGHDDERISKITYPGSNGKFQEINYEYTDTGLLQSVQLGQLEKKRYEYRHHHVTYHHYSMDKTYLKNVQTFTNKTLLPGQWTGQEKVGTYRTNGYLLEKIITPLGASIEFLYRDSLVTNSPPMVFERKYHSGLTVRYIESQSLPYAPSPSTPPLLPNLWDNYAKIGKKKPKPLPLLIKTSEKSVSVLEWS
jgi:hypothetical protein